MDEFDCIIFNSQLCFTLLKSAAFSIMAGRHTYIHKTNLSQWTGKCTHCGRGPGDGAVALDIYSLAAQMASGRNRHSKPTSTAIHSHPLRPFYFPLRGYVCARTEIRLISSCRCVHVSKFWPVQKDRDAQR